MANNAIIFTPLDVEARAPLPVGEDAFRLTRPERTKNSAPIFTPLDIEARATLPTGEAAYHLARAPQTLRLWASRENGPIRPLRINGRLAWPVSEIKALVGVPA